MNKKALFKFLIKANEHGYASGEATPSKREKDGSTTILFFSGEWSMHDNFFGGEPYGGRLVVFHKKKPHWIMVYYGNVSQRADNIAEVYAFLQHALNRMPHDAPFRGPKRFSERDFVYKNKWTGDLERYSGEEVILHKKKEIYRAWYMGGLVDQREE
ncbi:MAG: hypothetical protein HYV40_00075 [Candidatus Levybacteria bacterium]|nr:hypothetical protein [Candidatus Levybacteria bacterium]